MCITPGALPCIRRKTLVSFNGTGCQQRLPQRASSRDWVGKTAGSALRGQAYVLPDRQDE